MTYNEWRDELKKNLLCVSEQERARVLDYYAEAYADRRDAGYSEREITNEFGAPYDAAQRILAENPPPTTQPLYRNDNYARRAEYPENGAYQGGNRRFTPPPSNNAPPVQTPDPAQYGPRPAPQKREDNTWVFVMLCVIFIVPIFFVVLTMVCVTAGLCIAPFAMLISGVAMIGAGVGSLFTDAVYGATAIGSGMIIFGLSLIFLPLCFKLVKLMWKLFWKFFSWLKSLFSGKEKA